MSLQEQANSTEDDDDCRLPADTLLVLQEFLREKEQREQAEQSSESCEKHFEENWQLSQFWYNESTKQRLASVVKYFRESLAADGESIKVALLSCPSLYQHVKDVHPNVTLFEFDDRFASIGPDFQHFDYNRAQEATYLDDFRESFDVLIADPPFLSEECIEKIGLIVRKLTKPDNSKIILCSGFAVRDWAKKFLNLDICKFEPEHERNLGNQFSSYANFDLDQILEQVH
ncbi:protein-lysine N-methyltransferase CG9154 [Uranotaenia lowii]|uniref:protein-lysine N-methyltransferase CG9154 n=1 Tax=Uranotaenia lowii TaxID=190385 RepID=UPI00247A0068|nr:protein-lysine N-methyltransferase CG9154 [Uranotaenia lowii]